MYPNHSFQTCQPGQVFLCFAILSQSSKVWFWEIVKFLHFRTRCDTMLVKENIMTDQEIKEEPQYWRDGGDPDRMY